MFHKTALFVVCSMVFSANLVASEIPPEQAKAFKRCVSCHAAGGLDGGDFGPKLDDVFGRLVGSVEGYRYSSGLRKARDAGMVWDAKTLDAYIANPSKVIRSPRSIITEPSLNVPIRSFGPCMSATIAMGLPSSPSSSRII